VDFQRLKASSGASALKTLSEEVAKMSEGRKSDERFWSPTVDKGGNGFAVIRFLPAPPNEDVPFVRIWDHGFKGPGGWYIENSLTTIGKDDPVSELNTQLWNSSSDDDSPQRKQARTQKRRLHYVSNIYVVQDKENPANDGRVFLFKYGKKIFTKIMEAMEPQFADEEAMNAFDMWEGANFKLKIRNFEGYRNYDKSEFDKPSVLHKNEEKLEEIWKSEYPLQPFLDEKNFKSYDELAAKLKRVLTGNVPAQARKEAPKDDVPWDEDEAPRGRTAPTQNQKRQAVAEEDDEGDTMAWLQSLAEKG
jgi:hypothetical protein